MNGEEDENNNNKKPILNRQLSSYYKDINPSEVNDDAMQSLRRVSKQEVGLTNRLTDKRDAVATKTKHSDELETDSKPGDSIRSRTHSSATKLNKKLSKKMGEMDIKDPKLSASGKPNIAKEPVKYTNQIMITDSKHDESKQIKAKPTKKALHTEV